jgi:adenosine deaminase
MFAAGLNVSVNSDDPAYFSTTLTEELLVAMAFAGCSAGDIARLQSNAADAAFLTGDERRALRDRVEAD